MSTRPPLAVRGRQALWIVAVALLVAGCAGPTIERPPRPPSQAALAPRPDGGFAGIEAAVRSRGGADASGFELLERNEDGLRWRLALIDSARYSIDAQYYVWYGDAAGRLLLKHLLDAAARGVRVRMLVDDLSTLLKDASTVSDRRQRVCTDRRAAQSGGAAVQSVDAARRVRPRHRDGG